MDTNSEKSFRELFEEAEAYDDNDPVLDELDGGDFFRLLKTIKKELAEGVYDNK